MVICILWVITILGQRKTSEEIVDFSKRQNVSCDYDQLLCATKHSFQQNN